MVSEQGLEDILAQKFICARCYHQGGRVHILALPSIFMHRNKHEYIFVSCTLCGYTDIYHLQTFERKANLGAFVERLYAGVGDDGE